MSAQFVRITLEAPAETAPGGDVSTPWTPQVTVNAQWEALSGMNRNGVVADAVHRFSHIRHRTDVTVRWRVGLGARKFGIVSVTPDGHHRFLTIAAQEILA
jgi:head-tail adaptor